MCWAARVPRGAGDLPSAGCNRLFVPPTGVLQDPADFIDFSCPWSPLSQNRYCLSGAQVREGEGACRHSITFLKPSQKLLPNLLFTPRGQTCRRPRAPVC